MMNENSLIVYKDIKDQLSKRQKIVIKAIEFLRKGTCKDVADYLGVFPHTISGRFTELKNKGLIKAIDKKYIGGRPNDVFELCM